MCGGGAGGGHYSYEISMEFIEHKCDTQSLQVYAFARIFSGVNTGVRIYHKFYGICHKFYGISRSFAGSL